MHEPVFLPLLDRSLLRRSESCADNFGERLRCAGIIGNRKKTKIQRWIYPLAAILAADSLQTPCHKNFFVYNDRLIWVVFPQNCSAQLIVFSGISRLNF